MQAFSMKLEINKASMDIIGYRGAKDEITNFRMLTIFTINIAELSHGADMTSR